MMKAVLSISVFGFITHFIVSTLGNVYGGTDPVVASDMNNLRGILDAMFLGTIVVVAYYGIRYRGSK